MEDDNIVSDETKMFLMMDKALLDEPLKEDALKEVAQEVALKEEATEVSSTNITPDDNTSKQDEEMERYIAKFAEVKANMALFRQSVLIINDSPHDQHRIEMITKSLNNSCLLLESMFSLMVDMNNVLGGTD